MTHKGKIKIKSRVTLSDGFTLVAKEQPDGKLRKNSLYYHLQNFGVSHLLDPNLVIGHKFAINQAKPVILNLSIEQANNIFENHGYILYERHIRIDEKFYKHDGQNLLTQWHYTETYHKDGAPIITVHLYFNYTKQVGRPTVQNGSSFKILDPDLQEYVRNNSCIALKVMSKLFKSLEVEHSRLEAQYEDQAKKLSQVEYLAALSSDQKELAVKECRETSQKLQIYYEDIIDRRFELLEKQIEHTLSLIKEHNKPLVQTASKNLEQDQLLILSKKVHSTAEPKSKNADKVAELNKQISAIKDKIRGLINKIKSELSIEEMLKIEEERTNIKEELLIAYFKADEINPILKNTVRTLEKMLDDKNLSIFEKFKEFALAANFEKVVALYPHIENLNSLRGFYLELIINYICTKPNEDLQTINQKVKICEFFYENSSIYRQTISCISGLHKNANSEQALGLIAHLIELENFELFKTFISQTGDPNCVGMLDHGLVMSILDYAIAKGKIKFFNYLLEQGAICDNLLIVADKISLADISSGEKKNWLDCNLVKACQDTSDSSFIKVSTKNKDKKPLQNKPAEYNTLARMQSNFTLALYIDSKELELEIVKKIAKKTSLDNLFFAIRKIIGLSTTDSFMCFSDSMLGIESYRTATDRDNRLESIIHQNPNYLSFLLGSSDERQLQIIRILINELNRRKCSIEINLDLAGKISNFNNLSEQCLKEDMHYVAVIAKEAKLYMLTYAVPSLDVHKEILKTMIEIKAIYAENFKYKGIEFDVSQLSMRINLFIISSRFQEELSKIIEATPSTSSKPKLLG